VSRNCNSQRRGDLGADDNLVDGIGEGQPLAAQIEERFFPVADYAFVAADAALPPDRRLRLGP